MSDDAIHAAAAAFLKEFAEELELVDCVERLARQGGKQEIGILDQLFVLELERVGVTHAGGRDADEGMDEEVLRLECKLLRQGLREQRVRLRASDMLTLQQAAEVSGIPVRTLTHMRTAGRVLALAAAGAERGFRYPSWQFDAAVLETMATVIAAFGRNRAWQIFDFLTYPEPLLCGEVPVDVIRAGRKGEVIRILDAVASPEQGAY